MGHLFELYNSSSLKPVIKALAQSFPLTAFLDNTFSEAVRQNQARKEFQFFTALGAGEIELDEATITNSDFLHAYFSTGVHVMRSRSDEKVKRFADLFRALANKKVTFDDHEDLNDVLHELTDREFYVLCSMKRFEIEYSNENHPDLLSWKQRVNKPPTPAQLGSMYWERFTQQMLKDLNMAPEDFNPLIIRLQRTGCYVQFKGHWDESPESQGTTSSLFGKLCQALEISF